MEEETDLTRAVVRLSPIVLGPLGVEELRAFIGELRQEIIRVEAEIARKQAHRSSAEAFFRTSPLPE